MHPSRNRLSLSSILEQLFFTSTHQVRHSCFFVSVRLILFLLHLQSLGYFSPTQIAPPSWQQSLATRSKHSLTMVSLAQQTVHKHKPILSTNPHHARIRPA